MRLVHLIDSREYVRANCFQHQLLAHILGQRPVYRDVTVAELRAGAVCPEADVVLSTLRLRTLVRELEVVRRALGHAKVHVYDQDPWEAFVDGASCRGAYGRVAAALNVASFLVTSRWWARHVEAQGMPARFVRMWPLPEYCDPATPWQGRPIEVGFKGTLHPHRRASVERLARMGVNVTVLPPGPYDKFLRDLSRMRFFFHDESGEGWRIDGMPIDRNCVWIKEVEAMARGCLAIRVDDDESAAYCEGLPALRAVRSLDDVPNVIDEARRDPARAAADSAETVKRILKAPHWSKWIDLATLAEEIV